MKTTKEKTTTLVFLAAWFLQTTTTTSISTEGEWSGEASQLGETLNDFVAGEACQAAPSRPLDAIIVLGGGPQEHDGEPPVWVRRRLDAALELARCSEGGGGKLPCFITTSLGSAHVPNALDADGFPISEAQCSAAYLIKRGVDPGRIYTESASWDTIGNAVFVRQMHTAPRGWTNLAVVTSDFHLRRSRAIFEWIFGLAPLATKEGNGYALRFWGVSDEGVAMAGDRSEREKKSLASVANLVGRLKSMEDVHEWMYTGHDAYSAGGKMKRLTGKDRAMYGGPGVPLKEL